MKNKMKYPKNIWMLTKEHTDKVKKVVQNLENNKEKLEGTTLTSAYLFEKLGLPAITPETTPLDRSNSVWAWSDCIYPALNSEAEKRGYTWKLSIIRDEGVELLDGRDATNKDILFGLKKDFNAALLHINKMEKRLKVATTPEEIKYIEDNIFDKKQEKERILRHVTRNVDASEEQKELKEYCERTN